MTFRSSVICIIGLSQPLQQQCDPTLAWGVQAGVDNSQPGGTRMQSFPCADDAVEDESFRGCHACGCVSKGVGCQPKRRLSPEEEEERPSVAAEPCNVVCKVVPRWSNASELDEIIKIFVGNIKKHQQQGSASSGFDPVPPQGWQKLYCVHCHRRFVSLPPCECRQCGALLHHWCNVLHTKKLCPWRRSWWCDR